MHIDTIIVSYQAAPALYRLLLAAQLGDEQEVRAAAEELTRIDPAAATLAPLLLAPYAEKVEIHVPWLEDMLVYAPLVTMPEPLRLTQLLREACKAGAKVKIVTRSGSGDREAGERLVFITRLPRGCLNLVIDERVHTKLYRALIGEVTVEALSTANLTAQEVWKTRIGENKTILTVRRVSE